MANEIPFCISNRGDWPTPVKPRNIASVLPAYGEALRAMADLVRSDVHDGVLTLGYSAGDMWSDMKVICTREGIVLPQATHIVDQPSWNLYSGYFPAASAEWKKLGLPLSSPLIVEDYAVSGRKAGDLNDLFWRLGLDVRYAYMQVKPEVRTRFHELGIQPLIAVQEPNRALFNLLLSRRTPALSI